MRATPHRQAWAEHQNFPSQALLLESHDAFLAQGEQFAERVARVISGEGLSERQRLRFATRLEEEFRDWQWGRMQRAARPPHKLASAAQAREVIVTGP